jgi:phosphoglycerate dehydrogenase-like enzyme
MKTYVVSMLDLPQLEDALKTISDVRFDLIEDEQAIIEALPDVDVLIAKKVTEQMLPLMSKCRLVQYPAGGIHPGLNLLKLSEKGIPVCTVKGIFGNTGAEHALGLMFAFTRCLHHDMRDMAQGSSSAYRSAEQTELVGKTIGIWGLGDMGLSLAKKCSLLGMKVLGFHTKKNESAYVEQIYTADMLPSYLSILDFFAVAVPVTQKTTGAVNSDMLAAMKDSAFLIDMSGRNALYDLDALRKALRRGQIAGAGLQLQKPPEEGDPLWKLDNFIYSHHRATSVEQYERFLNRIVHNVNAAKNGTQLEGLADPSKTY